MQPGAAGVDVSLLSQTVQCVSLHRRLGFLVLTSVMEKWNTKWGCTELGLHVLPEQRGQLYLLLVKERKLEIKQMVASSSLSNGCTLGHPGEFSGFPAAVQ